MRSAMPVRRRTWQAVESSTASSDTSSESDNAAVQAVGMETITPEVEMIITEICDEVCAMFPDRFRAPVEATPAQAVEPTTEGLGKNAQPKALESAVEVAPQLEAELISALPRTYGVIAPPAISIKVARTTLYTSWEERMNGWKRAVLRCFCLGDAVDDWVSDDVLRQGVRDEMLLSCAVTSSGGSDEDQPTESGDTVPELGRALCEAHNTLPHQGGTHEVELVPRIVACAVVALRMKLGLGAMRRDGPEGPGNVAIVRREAPKMLRDWGMRDMDAAAHLYSIERAFFEDDAHYRVQNWRARACSKSRFVRWVIGGSEPVRFDC